MKRISLSMGWYPKSFITSDFTFFCDQYTENYMSTRDFHAFWRSSSSKLSLKKHSNNNNKNSKDENFTESSVLLADFSCSCLHRLPYPVQRRIYGGDHSSFYRYSFFFNQYQIVKRQSSSIYEHVILVVTLTLYLCALETFNTLYFITFPRNRCPKKLFRTTKHLTSDY